MRMPVLCIRLIRWELRKALESNKGCLISLLGDCLYDGASFSLLYFIVNRCRGLAGWDANQVLFLFAFHLFVYSVSATFCRGLCASLPQRIQTGKLDQAFIKPIHPLLYLILREIRATHLFRTPVTLFALCYAYGQMNDAVSAISVLLLLVMIVSAVLAQSAFFIAASGLGLLRSGRHPSATWIDSLSMFTRYPLQMYGAPVRVMLTFLVPLGFASYYPASVITGDMMDIAFSRILPYTVPMVSFFLLLGSVFLWRRACGRIQRMIYRAEDLGV